ncbi:MAG TPA: ATP-binding protein [Rhodocyclaceae bacterium]|nr:ATP-binding protein [Rhodocyclaceae bacterium]
MTYATPRLPIDRLGPRRGALLATVVIFGIAYADHATGYALRLSMLYLVPIAVAAWTAGGRAGYGAALLGTLLWLFSFQSAHFYRDQAYFFWEAIAMLVGFLAFAWLCARLSRALREADERFIRLIEQMHAAVYVADPRTDRIVYANPGLVALFGDPSALGMAEFERRWQRDGGDGGERRAGFAASTVRDRISGGWYLLQEGPSPWGGKPGIRLKLLTDLSDQKNAERLREKNLEVMHQAAQLTLLAETASTLAHEVNQPLMVIATYTDACQRLLAADAPELGEIAAVLAKCHAQAVRASSIIERLRDFVRRRRHDPLPSDPQVLVAEAVEVLRPTFEESGVTLTLTPAPAGRLVDVDRVLLVQVLTNLLRNAVEAMQDLAPAQRQLAVAVSAPTPGEVEFAIADRGPGIADDQLEAVFAPFVTAKPDGLGLGLAICRSVAAAHGGRLWASQHPDGGAVFHLVLPARAA